MTPILIETDINIVLFVSSKMALFNIATKNIRKIKKTFIKKKLRSLGNYCIILYDSEQYRKIGQQGKCKFHFPFVF